MSARADDCIPAADETARATTSVAPEETVRPAEASAAEPEVNEPNPSAPPAPTPTPILPLHQM